MREHMGLFRGKRLSNGKWMQGNLLQYSDGTCCICHAGSRVNHYKVDPDTIGECTGLRDKNGKLIWEGDIVRCGTGRICKVTFFTSPGVSGFDLVAIGGFNEPPPHNWVLFADTEIIGNVVDNPELLEGGEG